MARLTLRGRSLASLRSASSGSGSASASATGTPSHSGGSPTRSPAAPLPAAAVPRAAALRDPSGVYAYGSGDARRLAVVARASGAGVRELFTMPDAPSPAAPTAVDSLGESAPVILAPIPASGGDGGTALLVAYESSTGGAGEPTHLQLLQGTVACRVRLAVNVSSVRTATVAHGALYLIAAAHAAPDGGALRLWRVPHAAVAAGLCGGGASVPVAQVGAIAPRSRLSHCGGSLVVVGTTGADDAARLWVVDADGHAASHDIGGDASTTLPGDTLPGLACMGQSVVVLALASGALAFVPVTGDVVEVVSPAPDAAPYTSPPRALTVVGNDRLCFLAAPPLPAAAASMTSDASHSALFCWTAAGGIARVDGARVPASVSWMLPAPGAMSGGGVLYMPCTLAGAPSAEGAVPHACGYDFAAAAWRAVVDEATGAPVGAPYSSFAVAGTATFFAGGARGARGGGGGDGSAALWQLV